MKKVKMSIALSLWVMMLLGGLSLSCSSDEHEMQVDSKTMARRKMQGWNTEYLKPRNHASSDGYFRFGDANLTFEVQLDWNDGYYDRAPLATIRYEYCRIFDELYKKKFDDENEILISYDPEIISSGTYVEWSQTGISLHNVDAHIQYRITATIQHNNGDGTCSFRNEVINKKLSELLTIPNWCFSGYGDNNGDN